MRKQIGKLKTSFVSLAIIIVLLGIAVNAWGNWSKKQYSYTRYGLGFQYWFFAPDISDTKRYLTSQGILHHFESNNRLMLFNLTIQQYENDKKKLQVTLPFYACWSAKSYDEYNDISYRWFTVLVDLKMDHPIYIYNRLTAFAGGGIGLGLVRLVLNGRTLDAELLHYIAYGGIEYTLINRWLYLRIEGGYKGSYLEPNFERTEMVGYKRYPNIEVIEYIVTDSIPADPNFYGFYWGFSLNMPLFGN